jgi:hydrogenase expression/formation protein HypD
MEVCGGQTHAILRWGLSQLLPPGVRLIHGPGCPVCVTPAATIDAALALARRPGVILCSYGDMLRVPGSTATSLLALRAEGADVRLLTSPLQALAIARAHPRREVVFFAVGFETTAPATALLARCVRSEGLANLSLLTAHVRVAPAMEALLLPADPSPAPQGSTCVAAFAPASASSVQGFLAAGHVCGVIGTAELQELVERRSLPVVVSGFGPLELMRAILACVQLLEAATPRLLNAYGPVVRPEGNPAARALLEEVFEVVDQPWRGLGLIPGGGLALRVSYAATLEARRRFQPPGAFGSAPEIKASQGPGPFARPPGVTPSLCLGPDPASAAGPCIAAAILRGQATPLQCPAFGHGCTPEHPLGAPMVSGEGACAAYHQYRPPQGAAFQPSPVLR